jgi:hypothetical protein
MDDTVSEEVPRCKGGFAERAAALASGAVPQPTESGFCILGGSDASGAKFKASDLAIGDDSPQ